MKKIILFLTLLMSGFWAMAQISVEVVQHESCRGYDGVAQINLPEPSQDYLVTWSNGSHQALIDHLTQGTYAVKVSHTLCPDKPIFEDYVVINKYEGAMNVVITASTVREVTCDEVPVVKLTATAANGVAPLQYEWQTKMVSTDGIYTCQVTDANGCKAEGKLPLYIRKLVCDAATNAITGNEGFGENQMISANEKLNYSISFQNNDDLAQAPIAKVMITCDVPQSIDIETITFDNINLDDNYYRNLNENNGLYQKRIDDRDVSGVWVDVTAGIDKTRRQLYWQLQSVDPSTGVAPTNAMQGFLKANREGIVTFSTLSNSTAQSGDTLKAMAQITFDNNVPRNTNVWTNTYDVTAPTSRCDTMAVVRESQMCTLRLTATDNAQGAGVKEVELFVSENNLPYESLGIYSSNATIDFNYIQGYTYQFVTTALDNVGNREAFHAQPDVVLDFNEAPVALQLTPASFDENVAMNTLVGTFYTTDNNLDENHRYTLVSGDGDEDNNLFRIAEDKLYTNATFNCDGRDYYAIRVRTTDEGGLYLEKSFEVAKNVINPSYVTRIAREICFGDTYPFGKRLLTDAGVYYDSLQTVMGCDSIIELTLYVNDRFIKEEEYSVCDNELPMMYAGHLFDENTQSGTYPLSFVLPTGCDSLVILHLNVYKSYKGIEDRTSICQSPYLFSYKQFTDIDISEVGEKVIVDTFKTEHNCDSVVTLYLTVNPSYLKEEKYSICANDLPYKYDEMHTFEKGTVSGVYPLVYPLSTGCDSTIMLSLTVFPTYDNIFDEVSICQSNTPFTYKKFKNLDISKAGTQTIIDTFKTIHDCDSVVTLTLIVNPTYNINDVVETCQSTTPFNYQKFKNIDVSRTGTRMLKDVFQSVHGCDSAVSLTITVHPIYSGIFDTVYTCQSDEPFDYKGFKNLDVTEAGTKQITETLSSQYGCDSVVTLTMFIAPSFKQIIEDEICEGEPYDKNEFHVPAEKVVPPFYTEKRSYPAANSCDSSYILKLTVHPKHDVQLTDKVCQGAAYNKNGFVVSAQETQNVTLLTYQNQDNSQFGCDSLTTLKLQVEPVYHQIIEDEICAGVAYNKNGFNIPAEEVIAPSLVRTETYKTACLCDSVVELHLTVFPSYHKQLYDVTCQGEAYSLNGFNIPAGEVLPPYMTRTLELETENGCDSIITLNLTVYPKYENVLDRMATCQSSKPFSHRKFKDLDVSEAGVFEFTETFTTGRGCDSTVKLILTVYPSYDIVIEQTTCQSNTPYTYLDFKDIEINQPGLKTIRHINKTSMACDSITTLKLMVNPTYTKYVYDTICANEPYNKHGILIPSEEVLPPYVYRELIQETENQCDSSVYLYLTVHPHFEVSDEVTTCQSNLPFVYKKFQALDVSKAGTFEVKKTFDTPYGCDSTVILTLHVLPSYNISLTDVVCQGEAYQQNGFNIPAEDNQILGTYYYDLNLETHDGCDSIINLTLRVKPALGEVSNINGPAVITEAGTYTYSINPVKNAITYKWKVTNPDWILSANNSTTALLYVPTPGNGTLSVTAVNECREQTSYLTIQSTIEVANYADESYVKVFPNPTRDRVEVLIPDFEQRNCQNNCYIYVFDVYGKKLAVQKITSEQTRIDLSDYAGGLYLLRITNGANILGTYKVVKND